MTGVLRHVVSRRLVICVVVVFFALPPMIGYGWTRYRYLSGTSYAGAKYGVQTSGWTYREYNRAYHSEADNWRVRYINTNNTVVAYIYSYDSPTALGAGNGLLRADCLTITANSTGQPFNCDTTVP